MSLNKTWLLKGEAKKLALRIKTTSDNHNKVVGKLQQEYNAAYQEILEEHGAEQKVMWARLIELVKADCEIEQIALNFGYHEAHNQIYLGMVDIHEQGQNAQLMKALTGETEH